MPSARALIHETLVASGAAFSAQWFADLQAEGWSVSSAIVRAGMTVADVAALIGPCDHVQLLGHVPVPLVISGPDGHGLRAGGCDAPYATADLSGWGWNGAAFARNSWPSPAVRSVSRIDLSGLGDETAAFIRAMRRNHEYRTGAFEYDGVACLVDRFPDWQFPAMREHLAADMQAIVGAGNVSDLTSKYPDDQFFQSYAGRRFLLGALFSGGNQFEPREYYVGGLNEFASGLVQVGLLQIYCSYGWMFDTYPLLRAALAGGSLAAFWNEQGKVGFAGWNGLVTLGDVVRSYQRGQMIQTIQGDGTLRRREQDMGVSQAAFDLLEKRVAALEKGAVASGGTVDTGGGSLSGISLVSARYEVRDHNEIAADVAQTTKMVQAMIAAGTPIPSDDRYGDPWPGQYKQLRLTYTKAGVQFVKVIAQNTSVAVKDL